MKAEAGMEPHCFALRSNGESEAVTRESLDTQGQGERFYVNRTKEGPYSKILSATGIRAANMYRNEKKDGSDKQA